MENARLTVRDREIDLPVVEGSEGEVGIDIEWNGVDPVDLVSLSNTTASSNGLAASDPGGSGTLQLTLGAYSNMNVMDGGFVAIRSGRQHNLRVSRSLRPHFETRCGPMRVEMIEPLHHARLVVEGGDARLAPQVRPLALDIEVLHRDLSRPHTEHEGLIAAWREVYAEPDRWWPRPFIIPTPAIRTAPRTRAQKSFRPRPWARWPSSRDTRSSSSSWAGSLCLRPCP